MYMAFFIAAVLWEHPSWQGGSRQYLNYTFPVLPVSLTQFIEYVAFHEDFNEITMQFV